MPDLRPNPTLCLEYRAEQPIHHAFIQQASRCPAAIAIIGQHTTCNYSQLEQISAGIAAFLVKNATSGTDRVVIVTRRSAAWYTPCSAACVPAWPSPWLTPLTLPRVSSKSSTP